MIVREYLEIEAGERLEISYLRERDIEADQEILKISRFAAGRGMRLLTKDEQVTWWGGQTRPSQNPISIKSSPRST